MLIIVLFVCLLVVLQIVAILAFFSATTDMVEKTTAFALRQYDRFVRFVKWAASKPIAAWPVLLGGVCAAVRVATLACPQGPLHAVWGDWAHIKVVIPLLSDMIDACIKYVRKQHPFLRFLIKLVEMMIQLALLLLVIVARVACNPDIPLVVLWVIALPVLASIVIWKLEEEMPERWRSMILTNKSGGERPMEGLRNKLLFMCVATIIAVVLAIAAANKMRPLARVALLGSTDVLLLTCAFLASQLFATVMMSLQLDGDTVSAGSRSLAFWDAETTYTQYHYTMFVACCALAMLLVTLPFCNTALFAYRRLARMSYSRCN